MRLNRYASGLPILLSVLAGTVPNPVLQIVPHETIVRPCKVQAQKAAAEKKAAKRKKESAEQGDAGSANGCLEVHSSTLDVQEHLQSFVREQRWHVGREETSENLWTFSLELTQEELAGYTKTDSAARHVHWKAGKALVLARTTDLSDGYTRTVVSAQFEGYGESDDKFAVQRESWTLQSSGRLESKLIGALQAHYSAEH